jgi:hypothetical protein
MYFYLIIRSAFGADFFICFFSCLSIIIKDTITLFYRVIQELAENPLPTTVTGVLTKDTGLLPRGIAVLPKDIIFPTTGRTFLTWDIALLPLGRILLTVGRTFLT